MYRYNKWNIWYAFTLVEVMVSVTIMSIILVAIMTIFFSMSDVNHKTEISRQLQGNIKNAFEIMAADIRQDSIASSCQVLGATPGSFWCSWTWDKYYLGQSDENDWFIVASWTDCSSTTQCFLMKNWVPLTNSFMSVRTAQFKVLWDAQLRRLQMKLQVQPAEWKWVKTALIKNNIMNFQTTISENFLSK